MTISKFIEGTRERLGATAPGITANIYEKDDGIYLEWTNPWSNEKEMFAMFMWPGHPPEETGAVEKWYENSAKLFASCPSELKKYADMLEIALTELQYFVDRCEGTHPDGHIRSCTTYTRYKTALNQMREIAKGDL